MKYISSLVIFLFLLLSNGYADNSSVSDRPFSEIKQQMQEEQLLQEQLEESEQNNESHGVFDNNPPAVFFPYSCHSLASVSALGDTIVLEDGSTWNLDSYNSAVIMSWKSSEPLFIYPNSSWFSSHKYYVYNQKSNTSVPVTLTKGPIIGGDFSLQIKNIDYKKRLVYLNDDSVWQISSSDKYLLEDWENNDYIIVGHYSGWWHSEKNILLNVNMYNHVRAQEYEK
jgi:hypothetical protein